MPGNPRDSMQTIENDKGKMAKLSCMCDLPGGTLIRIRNKNDCFAGAHRTLYWVISVHPFLNVVKVRALLIFN